MSDRVPYSELLARITNRPPPNFGIRDHEIGEILGLPGDRALQACQRAGLEMVIRGKNHPWNVCCKAAGNVDWRTPDGTTISVTADHTCDDDAMCHRYREQEVRALGARWEDGTESELLTLAEVAAVLGASAAAAKRTLIEAGVVSAPHKGVHHWYRHQVEPLVQPPAQPEPEVDGVDVYEVAQHLGLSLTNARIHVATWTPIGTRSSGGVGAPRKVYPLECLDGAPTTTQRRRVTADIRDQERALRQEKEQRVVEIRQDYDQRIRTLQTEREQRVTEARQEYDGRIGNLRNGD